MLKVLVSSKLLSQTQEKKISIVLSDTAHKNMYSWLEQQLFGLEVHREISFIPSVFISHEY